MPRREYNIEILQSSSPLWEKSPFCSYQCTELVNFNKFCIACFKIYTHSKIIQKICKDFMKCFANFRARATFGALHIFYNIKLRKSSTGQNTVDGLTDKVLFGNGLTGFRSICTFPPVNSWVVEEVRGLIKQTHVYVTSYIFIVHFSFRIKIITFTLQFYINMLHANI